MNNSENFADELEKLTVRHGKQELAKARVNFFVKKASSVSLIVLAGPSGVGKSTLLTRFIQEFQAEHQQVMQENPSVVPILYTQAVASGHKSFDFRRLFSDGMRALNDPFWDYRNRNKAGRSANNAYIGETRSAGVMREDFEHELRTRGTKCWVIDEAHHVVRGGKSGHPGDQYDILKSLAQVNGVKLVLAGTYDLPKFLASSGQLSRRSATVQLDRYQWQSEVDRNMFLSVIMKVLSSLPMRSVQSVKEHGKYFYYGSVGCVGICKDWIARSFALAADSGDTALELKHFEQTQLDSEQLETLHADISRGEHYMTTSRRSTIDQGLMDRILGKEPSFIPGGSATPKSRTEISRKRRPGVRSPGRDTVGEVE